MSSFDSTSHICGSDKKSDVDETDHNELLNQQKNCTPLNNMSAPGKKKKVNKSSAGLKPNDQLSIDYSSIGEIPPPSQDSIINIDLENTTNIQRDSSSSPVSKTIDPACTKKKVVNEHNASDNPKHKVDESTILLMNKSDNDISKDNPTTFELITCLIRIMVPTMFSNILVFSIQTITNSYMGRRLGPTVFADFTIGVSTYNLFGFSFGVGLATALDTLVSQTHGRSKQRGTDIGIYFQQAILITIVLSIPVGLVLTYGEPLFSLVYGPEFGTRAVLFTKKAIPLFFIGTFYQVCIKTIVSINKPKLPIYASLCTVIVCVILNHYFTFSIESAVYVLTATYSTGLLVLMSIIQFHPRVHFWRECPWSASREVVNLSRIWKYLAIGIPCLISGCSDWWFYELLNVVAAMISVKTVAMMNVWLTVGLMVFSAALSNSVAVSVRVGSSLGANRPNLAKRYAYMGMIINLVMAFTNATILMLFRREIVTLFSSDPYVITYYCRIAPLISLHHVIDVMPLCLSGAYRGAGKPHQSAKIAIASLWFVGGPCTILFGKYMEMGTEGIIIGVTIGVAVETIFLLLGICFWNWEDIAHTVSHVNEIAPKADESTVCDLEERTAEIHDYSFCSHSCQGVYSVVPSSHSSRSSSSSQATSMISSISVHHH
eukprot:Tbor_TRINITY_DN5002_c0_g3::TRINITY_DN5002_c0_g3_i1::g.14149::m.14149/K03327/TC.MATE, SLC47A, norM, mdtK, dinF; multidrug resistance protein, MATE family